MKIKGQKGQEMKKRSLINEIVKIQVRVQWVKSDRTVKSALKHKNQFWRLSLAQDAFFSSIFSAGC